MTDLAAATSELIWRVDECRSNSQTTFLLGDSNCSNILLCQEILAYLVSLSQFFHQLTSEHYSQLDPFLPKDMLKKNFHPGLRAMRSSISLSQITSQDIWHHLILPSCSTHHLPLSLERRDLTDAWSINHRTFCANKKASLLKDLNHRPIVCWYDQCNSFQHDTDGLYLFCGQVDYLE